MGNYLLAHLSPPPTHHPHTSCPLLLCFFPLHWGRIIEWLLIICWGLELWGCTAMLRITATFLPTMWIQVRREFLTWDLQFSRFEAIYDTKHTCIIVETTPALLASIGEQSRAYAHLLHVFVTLSAVQSFAPTMYTAISRKVVGKKCARDNPER